MILFQVFATFRQICVPKYWFQLITKDRISNFPKTEKKNPIFELLRIFHLDCWSNHISVAVASDEKNLHYSS